jgi:Carbohydrate esterase, sialic acid-specific acetylesterase
MMKSFFVQGVLFFALGNLVSSLPLFADDLSITNPSFETDSIEGDGASVMQKDVVPTGWTWSGTGDRGLLMPNAKPNPYYTGDRVPGVDGKNVFYFFNTTDGQIQQTLSDSLQANTAYTLSAAVGNRSAGGPCGYRLALVTESGHLVGEWIGANNCLAPSGTFAQVSRTFVTGDNPPGLGDRLVIQIGQKAAGPNQSFDVDHVRLQAAKAPDIKTPLGADGIPIDVLIVSGQSNAQGWQGNSANLSPDNQRYLSDKNQPVYLAYKQKNLPEPQYNIGSMGLLAPQGSGFAWNFSGMGGEISLGHDVADHQGGPLTIIKYAVGSAGLNADYKKSANKLYPVMIDFIKDSLKQLQDQGFTPNLRGFFWLQGETDTGNKDVALNYGQNLKQFCHDVRADLHQPELSFFVTEINGAMPMISDHSKFFVDDVNNGMKSVASSDPRVIYIPIDDLKDHFGDDIHYSADQQILIGQRWAAAYLASQQPK